MILALVIVGSHDEFHLKDWQTIGAGILALGGGALAYFGAMAKVEQDAEQNKREFLRRQLGLYLKLDITIRNFRDAAEAVSTKVKFGQAGDRILVSELRLKEPLDIEVAWENLDVFPRRLIREIALIRESLRELDRVLAGLNDADRLIFENPDARNRLDMAHDIIAVVADASSIVVNGLAPEIEALAPAMAINERMVAVYGEPD